MLQEVCVVFTYQDSGGEYWFTQPGSEEQYCFPCQHRALQHVRPREGEEYWLLMDQHNRLIRALSRRQG